ncbi:MAG: phytanoyl-CoA dioxygenase family protein [bacterium]|nr:phytanoyl-CoA dioxygenase family protein [bacterium]
MNGILTQAEAERGRRQLVDDGYAVLPGVMPVDLLQDLRQWSDDVFKRLPVDPKYRYQGSDIHVTASRSWPADKQADAHHFADDIVERIIDQPRQLAICQSLGLESLRAHDSVILLSKPAFGPPLYWHQDYMNWNSPAAATPWPTKIFLSYYLTDTNRTNGCLRVIPGTHKRRIDLHDILPDAHGPVIQALEDFSHPAFLERTDSIDVPMRAGDLVIGDARLMHSAWPNQTDQRRTLILAWHDVFQFPLPPSWWTGDIPEAVSKADPGATYKPSRTPIGIPVRDPAN